MRSSVATVSIERGLAYGADLERTKSGRRREVPMRQAVYDVLANLSVPRQGRVWPEQSIRTAWETAVERAKLDDWYFTTAAITSLRGP